jgi:protein TonB
MIAALDIDARDLARWAISIAVVIGAHAGLAAALAYWPDQVEFGEPPGAIVLELAPLPVAPSDAQEDVPLEPEQLREETPEEKPEEMVEEKVEEKLEPEPDPQTEVSMVVPPPPKKVEEPPRPETPPTTTAAPRAVPTEQTAMLSAAPTEAQPTQNSNAIPSWKNQIVSIIERNKRYPAEARSRNEKGVVQVAFSITRDGQVASARIVRSSGSSALDADALVWVRRAGHYPPPPAELPGAQISITIPLRYDIR